MLLPVVSVRRDGMAVKIANAELMGVFVGLEEARRLRDSLMTQAPVLCPSCDQGWHAPWWNKSTAAPSHWTNEMIAGWASDR